MFLIIGDLSISCNLTEKLQFQVFGKFLEILKFSAVVSVSRVFFSSLVLQGANAELYAHSLCVPCTFTKLVHTINKTNGEVLKHRPRWDLNIICNYNCCVLTGQNLEISLFYYFWNEKFVFNFR